MSKMRPRGQWWHMDGLYVVNVFTWSATRVGNLNSENFYSSLPIHVFFVFFFLFNFSTCATIFKLSLIKT